MVVANTGLNGATDEQLFTRTNWDGTGAAQIDFIMTSAAIQVTNIFVEKHDWFKSDHRSLVCEWTAGKKRRSGQRASADKHACEYGSLDRSGARWPESN